MRKITSSSIRLKKRKKSSHKRENGVVLAIAGSEEFPGAAQLCSTAALAVLRSGADIVMVAAPEKAAWAISMASPEIITIKLKGRFHKPEHYKIIKEKAEKADALVIGPGIGSNDKTKKLISMVVGLPNPKVIDADPLRHISINGLSNALLTPHQKEFYWLLKNSKLTKSAFRKSLGNNVILLKGETDYIYTKEKTYFNTTGNPGMTKGGTGDVLAGLAAGILAQENSLEMSAIAAAYINGKAGELLMKERGYGFLASELVERIPPVMKRFLL